MAEPAVKGLLRKLAIMYYILYILFFVILVLFLMSMSDFWPLIRQLF
ncbi:hypothetical protein ACFL3V_06290 [Nanoarchaeota archaeon]